MREDFIGALRCVDEKSLPLLRACRLCRHAKGIPRKRGCKEVLRPIFFQSAGGDLHAAEARFFIFCERVDFFDTQKDPRRISGVLLNCQKDHGKKFARACFFLAVFIVF
jgi:hypothetical protein